MEEVSSGVRPIAAAGTSTAAFVGLAQKGPGDAVKRITSWTEYRKHYGTFIDGGFLAQSVFQFFNNGGSQCYIVRVTPPGAATAEVTVYNRVEKTKPGLVFSAKNEGQWGNYLYLQIEDGTDDPGNTFKLSIREQEVMDVVPEDFMDIGPLEVFDNLSMNPDSPGYVETVVNSRSILVDVRVSTENDAYQRGIHRGGWVDESLKLSGDHAFQVNIDYDGFQTVALSFPTEASLGDVATAIQDAVQGLWSTKKSTSTLDAAFSGFTCDVETVDGKSRLLLQSGTTDSVKSSVLILPASADNTVGILKLGEANGGLSEDALAVRRPENDPAIQIGDNALNETVVMAVKSGSDGSFDLSETDFSAAFQRLDPIADFSLLAVPGIGAPAMVDEGMNYCRRRPLQDVFYIGEMAQDEDEPAEAGQFRKRLTLPNSYGALYFPWVKSPDPSGKSKEPVLLPPSGYIAGLFARIDATRGVWKAPAGTEAGISGAVGLAANLTDVQQGNLNRINVNCLRRFAGSGIVSWGVRTVTSDPEWTYIPVRRMAIMLRVSIYNGIQWAVFEPNDEELWGQLRLNLNSFMMTLFRKGAFQGSSPGDAFFVKCDNETTTQDDIDRGIVNVLVGFAPLKPAEFVVVKISQKAGQSS
jgi:hypothetical protein